MYQKSFNKILHCSAGCMKSYGEDCRYPCNEHCVNQTCNRFHGICQFGCESGYHGQKCEQGIYTCICNRKLLTVYIQRIFISDLYYLFNAYQILEFPATSSLSTVAAGFIGASVSACVFIATAIVIFVIR